MRHVFSFILLINLLFFGAFLPMRATAQEENVPLSQTGSRLIVDGRLALIAITAYVDGQIECMAKMLETVAATNEAKSGQWVRIKPILADVKKRAAPAVIFFSHTNGSYFTVEKGPIGKNIKDRSYFSTVMAGNVSVGELVISRSTGKKVTIVAIPIKDKGGVIGLLGASMYLDTINSRVLELLSLPDNMVFYAFDDKFITSLHFRPKWIFQDPTKLQIQSLTNAVKEIVARHEGLTSYKFEGRTRDVIYHTSSLTGWHFILGKIREE